MIVKKFKVAGEPFATTLASTMTTTTLATTTTMMTLAATTMTKTSTVATTKTTTTTTTKTTNIAIWGGGAISRNERNKKRWCHRFFRFKIFFRNEIKIFISSGWMATTDESKRVDFRFSLDQQLPSWTSYQWTKLLEAFSNGAGSSNTMASSN